MKFFTQEKEKIDFGSGVITECVRLYNVEHIELSAFVREDLFKETDKTGILTDLETTGLDELNGSITEIAYIKFRYNDDGVVTKIEAQLSQLQETEEIPEVVQKVTGITPELTKGHEIHWDFIFKEFKAADIILAHNAEFERRWLLQENLELSDCLFGCSKSCIDWVELGCINSKLEVVLCQHGYYHDAHRAFPDVKANLLLTMLHAPDGETYLKKILDDMGGERYKIELDIPFKQALRREAFKKSGFKFDGDRKTWFKICDESEKNEIMDSDLGHYLCDRNVSTISPKERFAK